MTKTNNHHDIQIIKTKIYNHINYYNIKIYTLLQYLWNYYG